MEAEAVDGDDDLGVLVDHEAGQALGRGLDLAPKEGGAVVWQRPAEHSSVDTKSQLNEQPKPECRRQQASQHQQQSIHVE